MLTKTRTELVPSLDGDGWTVRIGESHWRFSRREFAETFQSGMEQSEEFSASILDHAYNHDWDKCDPRTCKGLLWQYIQSLP